MLSIKYTYMIKIRSCVASCQTWLFLLSFLFVVFVVCCLLFVLLFMARCSLFVCLCVCCLLFVLFCLFVVCYCLLLFVVRCLFVCLLVGWLFDCCLFVGVCLFAVDRLPWERVRAMRQRPGYARDSCS